MRWVPAARLPAGGLGGMGLGLGVVAVRAAQPHSQPLLMPLHHSPCCQQCSECFARMNVMDPHLRLRLAEWLAYHLSNFEYVWPWAKWAHVLAAPAYDGQRCGKGREGGARWVGVVRCACGAGTAGGTGWLCVRGHAACRTPTHPPSPPLCIHCPTPTPPHNRRFFVAVLNPVASSTYYHHCLPAPCSANRRFCVALLNRLVRLSYWERIQSVLPEEFRPLLPPKPEVRVWVVGGVWSKLPNNVGLGSIPPLNVGSSSFSSSGQGPQQRVAEPPPHFPTTSQSGGGAARPR